MAPQSAKEHFLAALAAKLNETPAKVNSNLAPQASSSGPSVESVSSPSRAACRRISTSGGNRHSRKCQICNHPERESIEADFVDWDKACAINQRYGLNGKSAIYRHARATGLDVRRRQNLGMVVEKVLEKVDYTDAPSASALLRAVRTLASLNERGQWVEPPTTHTVISVTEPPAQSAAASTTTARRRAPRRSPMEMISNRHTYEKLETGANHSKQRPEVISNRHT